MQHVLPLVERDDPVCIHFDRQGGSQIVTRQLEAVTTKAIYLFILLHFKPFNRPLPFYLAMLLDISFSAPSSSATDQICTAISLFTCPFSPFTFPTLCYVIPTKKNSASVTVFTLDLFQCHRHIQERKNKIKQLCTSPTVMGCF